MLTIKHKSNFIYLILLLSLFFNGCTNNIDKQNISNNSIDITELDLQKVKYNNSELVEDYYYLPLETIDTLNLIGKVDKVIFYKKKILILDRHISKAIFIFSDEGNYLGKIDKIGDGPGEFKEPWDFVVNTQQDQIILYCKKNRKLLFFDMFGDYLNELKLGLNFRSISIHNNKYFIFTHSIYNFHENFGELAFDLLSIDFKGNIINKQFPNGIELGNTSIVITHNDYFTKNNSGLYLSWVLNDTIYKISENNYAEPFCYFNFGENSIPEQIIKNTDEIYIYKDVVIDGLYWSKYGPLKYADGKFLTIISAGISNQTINNFYNVLFSDDFKEKVVFNEIIFDDDAVFNFPITNLQDYFVSILYPEEILHIKLNNKDNTKIYLKGIETKIRKYDNPILMFTKLK